MRPWGGNSQYDLLHAVSPLDEEILQQGLRQLVEAELVYQRGLPPRRAISSSMRSYRIRPISRYSRARRQQLHQQIAQVLEEQFPQSIETQPELLAHHYTEAGLYRASDSLLAAGRGRASQRSANVEAISHLTKGLELLKTLPDTPERVQQELTLQTRLE